VPSGTATHFSDYYQYQAIPHDARHRQITPRMVLTHSPGFPNWRPRGGQLTINFEPGTEFSYSGEGFVYLLRAVELNVAEHPDASNPYDSLGEAYLAAGDTANAILNYQKSVELNPANTTGAAVLRRLRPPGRPGGSLDRTSPPPPRKRRGRRDVFRRFCTTS
jgi:hypothetical protein